MTNNQKTALFIAFLITLLIPNSYIFGNKKVDAYTKLQDNTNRLLSEPFKKLDKVSNKDRFTIIEVRKEGILLDKRTGETWIINKITEDELAWVPLKKFNKFSDLVYYLDSESKLLGK